MSVDDSYSSKGYASSSSENSPTPALSCISTVSFKDIPIFEKNSTCIPRPKHLKWIPPNKARTDAITSFKFESLMGEGGYASVFHVVKRECSTPYALKVIPRNKSPAQMYTRECKIMMNLRKHEGIIKLYDYFIDQNSYYLLMELGDFDLDNLMLRVQKFSLDKSRVIILKLLQAVAFMHKYNVVHRDIKPRNIIFVKKDGLSPKLIDFGHSMFVDDLAKYTFHKGTPCYLAPERWRTHYGWEMKASDVWAIGVIAFELVTGKECFRGDVELHVLKESITKGNWSFPEDRHICDSFRHFIECLLTVDSCHRPTALQCLKHPWITQKNLDISSIQKVSLQTYLPNT